MNLDGKKVWVMRGLTVSQIHFVGTCSRVTHSRLYCKTCKTYEPHKLLTSNPWEGPACRRRVGRIPLHKFADTFTDMFVSSRLSSNSNCSSSTISHQIVRQVRVSS